MNSLKLVSLMAFGFISLVWSIGASANYTGTVYEQGSNKQKELFKFQHEFTTVDGKEQSTSTFKDLEGNLALEQTVILDGSKIVRDEVDQKQLNQVGLIEVKDGKVYFSKTVNGKTTTSDEKLGKTFVTTGNFQRFVKDNWDDIKNGKEVEFRFGVWDRQETVGFEIFKISEDKVGDQPVLVLKMKPSSFIISALVKPLIFKFAADGSRLVEMNGRVAPKQKIGKDYKDLDAEVVYAF